MSNQNQDEASARIFAIDPPTKQYKIQIKDMQVKYTKTENHEADINIRYKNKQHFYKHEWFNEFQFTNYLQDLHKEQGYPQMLNITIDENHLNIEEGLMAKLLFYILTGHVVIRKKDELNIGEYLKGCIFFRAYKPAKLILVHPIKFPNIDSALETIILINRVDPKLEHFGEAKRIILESFQSKILLNPSQNNYSDRISNLNEGEFIQFVKSIDFTNYYDYTDNQFQNILELCCFYYLKLGGFQKDYICKKALKILKIENLTEGQFNRINLQSDQEIQNLYKNLRQDKIKARQVEDENQILQLEFKCQKFMTSHPDIDMLKQEKNSNQVNSVRPNVFNPPPEPQRQFIPAKHVNIVNNNDIWHSDANQVCENKNECYNLSCGHPICKVCGITLWASNTEYKLLDQDIKDPYEQLFLRYKIKCPFSGCGIQINQKDSKHIKDNLF